MIYLGLHNSFQSGAALIIDNKIVGAVTEERLCREKDFHGWPERSIKYLLNLGDISIQDVDKIVYGMVTSVTPDQETLTALLAKITKCCAINPELEKKYFERVESEMQWNEIHLKRLEEWMAKNSLKDKIEFVDHHYSHAAGGYYTSPFKNAMVFTFDGKGNFRSGSVGIGNGDELKIVDFYTTFDSFGYFFGNITKALGFKPNRHEGKISALAAYGDAEKFNHIIDQIIRFKDEKFELQMGKYYLPWLVGESDLPDLYEEIKKNSKEDVAAAAQSFLEKTITKYVDKCIKKYNNSEPTNIVLSGGVFSNIKLNQKIRQMENVSSVFVQPAMGDMGIPLGSCLAQMAKDGNPYKNFLNNMSLGPSFSNKEIKKILDKKNIVYKELNNIAKEVVDCINSSNVVGFFNGRMEFGPRALCNRSILYHCRDKDINIWLNKRLERTDFMPFAPVTTEELAEKCFIDWSTEDRSGDFMTMTYNVSKIFADICPAAVHIDGTARPQIVRKNDNALMHNIITQYHNLTGELALINTSFNNHEDPIVCDVYDALNSFENKNVDVLIIEKFKVGDDI